MSYRTQTITTNSAWRVGSRGNDNCWPGTLAKDNAAVNGSGTVTTYGKVVAGTVLAEDSSGNLHPAGCAEIEEVISGAVAFVIPDLCAPNFYIGDEVAVLSVATERTIAVVGEADDETFTAATAHGLIVGDQVAISALTGGTGATAGSYVVATVPSATTFTLTGVAFSTDISAGTLTIELPEPVVTNITGTRNIATINHATGAGTLSGATFSAAVGDLLVKIGAYKPAGFLNDTVSTRRYVDDTEVTEDRAVNLALEGDVRTGYATGVGARLRQILKGGTYPDPIEPDTTITPKFVGFTFRDV